MIFIGSALSGLPLGWDLSTPVLAVAAVATVLFDHAFVRLRRRGRADLAGWDRPALFAVGILFATVPLISPNAELSVTVTLAPPEPWFRFSAGPSLAVSPIRIDFT